MSHTHSIACAALCGAVALAASTRSTAQTPPFESALQIPPSGGSRALACGDVDHDGLPDVVVGTYNSVHVRVGYAPAAYTSPLVVQDGVTPGWLTVLDLDADGWLEIADTSSNSTIALCRATGPLQYAAPLLHASAGASSVSLVHGDLDQDGIADLMHGLGTGFRVLRGTTSGPLLALPNQSSGSAPLFNVEIADLDGDGVLDAVTSSNAGAASRVDVHFGNGDGTFGAGHPHACGGDPVVRAGDLDQDGAVDLVTANYASADLSVLRALGGGAFAPAYSAGFIVSNAWDLALADIDGNASLDAIATSTGEVALLGVAQQDGSGGFVFSSVAPAAGATWPATWTYALAVADCDLDGRPDVLTSGLKPYVELFRNALDGHGAWSALGPGSAGANGIPKLVGTGPLLAGSATGLYVSSGELLAPAFLVLGAAPLAQPLLGATLYAQPDVIVPLGALDLFGTWSQTFAWPVGIASGSTIAAQAWVIDAASASGLAAASNGVLATTP